MTASLRFNGSMNIPSLDQIVTNLVPQSGIKFPLVSYAPFLARERAGHKSNSVAEITDACFAAENQMIQCDPKHGKYMSCCLLYRGDIPPGNVDASIKKIQNMKRFHIDLK